MMTGTKYKEIGMGNHLTLTSPPAAHGYLAFRFPEIDWRGTHPNLARLYDKLMQRPAFAESVPKG